MYGILVPLTIDRILFLVTIDRIPFPMTNDPVLILLTIDRNLNRMIMIKSLFRWPFSNPVSDYCLNPDSVDLWSNPYFRCLLIESRFRWPLIKSWFRRPVIESWFRRPVIDSWFRWLFLAFRTRIGMWKRYQVLSQLRHIEPKLRKFIFRSTSQRSRETRDVTGKRFCLEWLVTGWSKVLWNVEITKYIYIQITEYVPSSELGLSHLLSRQRVCPSPRYQGGAHSLPGEGLGEFQFWRLEKSLALCLLCDGDVSLQCFFIPSLCPFFLVSVKKI